MGKRTSLYDCHVKAGAKLVEFAGWDMPLHYGSQLDEHRIVREDKGVFDVSHMTVVDMKGSEVASFLRYLLANNIDRLKEGQALYTCMLNEAGGVIDDLIVYKLNESNFRLIVNSGTRDKDLAWLNQQSKSFDVEFQERNDLAMLALQGPSAREALSSLFTAEEVNVILSLKPFFSVSFKDYFIARTGYTGEEGFEILLPNDQASSFWGKVIAAGFHPCGLGARDTLRLEAGLNLYGSDMDESVSPLESNLTWTVAFEPKDRAFIGRAALEKQLAEGVKRKLVGLVLEGQGVLRNHQKVILENEMVGEITSGSFSPTLSKGIALARVNDTIKNTCFVEMRGKPVLAQVVKPPFVRFGKKVY